MVRFSLLAAWVLVVIVFGGDVERIGLYEGQQTCLDQLEAVRDQIEKLSSTPAVAVCVLDELGVERPRD